MRYLLLLAAVFAVAKSTDAADCDACIQKQCYVKELVYEDEINSNLVVDLTTNELYFLSNEDYTHFTKVLCNLDTNTTRRLNIPDNVYLPYAAFDQVTKELYLSNDTKLYVYKNDTLQDMKLDSSLRADNVTLYRQLQYKNNLHIALEPYGLCHVVGGEVLCYKTLENTTVDDFVIDKNNDIFYKSGSELYKFQQPNPIHTFPITVANLGVDIHGELYYSLFDKIWKYNYDNGDFDEVGLVADTHIFVYTFDRNNNLIYLDIEGLDKIYRLLPKQGTSCTIEDKHIVIDGTTNTK